MFKLRYIRSGFTLLHLIVIISILAILAITAIPRILSSQQTMREKAVASTASAMQEAIYSVNTKFQTDLSAGVAVDHGIPGSSCLGSANGTASYAGVLIGEKCVDVLRSPPMNSSNPTMNGIYAVGSPEVEYVYPAATENGIGNALSSAATKDLQIMYVTEENYSIYTANGNLGDVMTLSDTNMAFFAPLHAPAPTPETYCQAVYNEGNILGTDLAKGKVFISVYLASSTAGAPQTGC